MFKAIIFLAILTLKEINGNDFFDLIGTSSDLKEFLHGGGKEYFGEKHSSRGEKGETGYEGKHQAQEGVEGHHDQEGQKKHYSEEGGNKNAHHHDDGYHAQKHKAEKGTKGYNYADKGSYAKGHSTKGHHNVHKLNEFQKKTEFFDEDHDEAYKEKHGGFEEKASAKGGSFQGSGHLKKVHFQGDFAKAGEVEKGSHFNEKGGFDKAEGRDSHFKNYADFGKFGGKEGGRLWKFVGYH